MIGPRKLKFLITFFLGGGGVLLVFMVLFGSFFLGGGGVLLVFMVLFGSFFLGGGGFVSVHGIVRVFLLGFFS